MQDSEKYVEELLNLFNRFSKLVREAFQDDPRFLTARDKVFLDWNSNNIYWPVCSLFVKAGGGGGGGGEQQYIASVVSLAN